MTMESEDDQMATVAVDVAMESTSQEILKMLQEVKMLVSDVSKFDWKNFWEQMATDEVFSTKFYYFEKHKPEGRKNECFCRTYRSSIDRNCQRTG